MKVPDGEHEDHGRAGLVREPEPQRHGPQQRPDAERHLRKNGQHEYGRRSRRRLARSPGQGRGVPQAASASA